MVGLGVREVFTPAGETQTILHPAAMLVAIAALPPWLRCHPLSGSSCWRRLRAWMRARFASSAIASSCRWGWKALGIIRHPGASLAVPITDDGQVVLLRQYRFAVQARLLEFPAGTLEEGEDPLESMQRELGEEAGYSAARWDALGPMLPCPGYSDEVIHCFLARELTPLENPPAGDDDEDLEVC